VAAVEEAGGWTATLAAVGCSKRRQGWWGVALAEGSSARPRTGLNRGDTAGQWRQSGSGDLAGGGDDVR